MPESPKIKKGTCYSFCKRCNKPLKLIGIERKNGRGYYTDWSDREYHKRCWHEMCQINLFIERYGS